VNGHFFTFEVVGHPEPAGSKRAVPTSRDWRIRPGVRWQVLDANANADPWKRVVANTAKGAMLKERAELIDGPVFVSMVFRLNRPQSHFRSDGMTLSAEGNRHTAPAKKPDALKLARAVEDALTGIVYKDDASIVSEQIRKEFTVGPEGVLVTVMPL
jgi:Holliday junction resolvase RusA-like endonuclease